MRYSAKLQPASQGGYVVRFPAIPGAVTQGETIADAVEMAADCLRTHLLGLIALGESIPEPGAQPVGKLVRPIALAALDAAKVQLYRTFRASGMKMLEFELACPPSPRQLTLARLIVVPAWSGWS